MARQRSVYPLGRYLYPVAHSNGWHDSSDVSVYNGGAFEFDGLLDGHVQFLS